MIRQLPFDYAARNLGRSPLRLVLSIGGSALVVLLVLASAAFVNGMKRSLQVTGSERNVIILGSGSEESIERSEIAMRTASIVAASVEGIRSRLNVSYVSPEIHMALSVMTDAQAEKGALTVIRGVDSRAFLVHQQVRIIEGRFPEAGRDEVMVGRLVASKLGLDERQLDVGSELWIDGRPWTLSGLFEAPQTVMDAEIWCPLTDLQIVAQRDSLSCVVVTLGNAELADIQAFAAQRLDLEITAMSEVEYYQSLANFFGPIRMLVLVTASLIAMGGVMGGLNTMYAAFASRVRELGSLQVLGYRRLSIVISLIQESTLTSAIGSIIAIALGLLVLDGVAIKFSMGAFGLIVDHQVVLVSLLAGLTLGVVGALPPAIRCLRMPITEALKSG
ncbi:MAG: ABC transporter permease [Planctomycetota bacterium]|nr:ABC transporter permease [Planctomycetota bacterium]